VILFKIGGETMQERSEVEEIECPCCDKAGSRLWVDEGRGTQYRSCCACGTIFASPRAPRKKRVAAFTSGWGKETAVRIARLRRLALQKVASLIQTQSRAGGLVDCGCSSGALFESFDRTRWQCHGVEISPTAAAYAAESTGAFVHTGTLFSVNYPSEYFDLVTIIDTFYYFDDPLEQLREAARVLRSGGVLGIEIPGYNYSKARSRGLVCLLLNRRWYRLASDSHYLCIYSARGFQRLVEKAGFVFVRFETIPSPQTSRVANLLSGAHYGVMQKLLPHFPQLVDWVPKVLWVFRKQ
jgi:SAM-dependent methyltransferase